jgi:hypothetical protein
MVGSSSISICVGCHDHRINIVGKYGKLLLSSFLKSLKVNVV